MFGTLGVQEMIVIFIVALVLFGPKKLPELGRTIGKAITEFRRASSDLKATFEREMQSLERESESLKEVTQSAANDISSHSSYEYQYYDSGSYLPDSYDSTATNPSTVSASEVPGAESQGTTQAASVERAAEAAPAVEGTVPRTAEAGSKFETQPVSEAPQHS